MINSRKGVIVKFQVYRVGVVKELLVSHTHCGSWLVNSDISREDSSLVSIRPWMSFASCGLHEAVLEKYWHAVETFILTHPGVTLVRGRGRERKCTAIVIGQL